MTSDEHDTVLLQVVSLSRDVRRDLETGGDAHFGDLSERGIGLLGRLGVDSEDDAAALGAVAQGRLLELLGNALSLSSASLSQDLVDCDGQN